LNALLNCPKCGDTPPKWRVSLEEKPVEIAHCARCDAVLKEVSWEIPFLPLTDDNCINCTHEYLDGKCRGCGLTNQEAYTHHDEILDLVHPNGDFISGSAIAEKQGRVVLALKLITATAADDENDLAVTTTARNRRIALLNSLKYEKQAVDDATIWTKVENNNNNATAALARQLFKVGSLGLAVEKFKIAIENAPEDYALHGEYAELMLEFGRVGQARVLALSLIKHELDTQAKPIVLRVFEKVAHSYHESHNYDELQAILEKLGKITSESGELLCYRAALAVSNGDEYAAKKDLKAAKRMGHKSKVMSTVYSHLGIRETPWWKFW
jgi:tetratricopeptide (TPR) repeat protein